MPRELRYLAIADELRRAVGAGDYPPGRLLPSESELATTHRASRVTVRKALSHLKDEGIVDSRQGFGWFGSTTPLRQSLRDMTTIENQIKAAGRRPSREVLRLAVVPTPPSLAGVLGTSSVLEIARIDRVDAEAFACATVWVRDDLCTGLSRRALERRPLSELLKVDLGAATQVISAVGAATHEADLLGLPKGAPLLRCERTTTDSGGRPVLRSLAFYNPLITEFVAELPAVETPEPGGLKLVAAWNTPVSRSSAAGTGGRPVERRRR